MNTGSRLGQRIVRNALPYLKSLPAGDLLALALVAALLFLI